jgi:pimeloyl-ACP methyl ester carboxylesterase
MAIFVLVHGSFQASWCWREVAPRLEARGHRALTLDLPGHGIDPTPVERVVFQDYVNAILRVVGGLDERPILVEHSMGTPIAAAAEADPDAVAALAFVAGLLPRNGSSLLEAVGNFDPAYLARAIWADDGRSVRIAPAGVREFLYSDVSPDVVEDLIPLLTAEPIGPYEAPFTATDQKFGRVRRYYVETRRDRIVLPAIQQAIQARVTFERVFSLDAGHAPFFSTPNELVSHLDSVAREI